MDPQLNQQIFHQTLTNEHFTYFTKFYCYNSLESTNSTAKELIEKDSQHGTVIVAAEQTKGRGRYARQWVSSPGGLYISLAFHPIPPQKQYTLFPLLAAISVHFLLNKYSISSKIKWPNDVLVNTKKIAGILIETETKNPSKPILICGIGINVNNDVNNFPSKLLTPATSLIHETGRHIDLLTMTTRLIHIFEEHYTQLVKKGPEEIIDHWKQATDTLGKHIQITQQHTTIKGIAENIDSNGFLLLRSSSGELHRITSGDCLIMK